MTNEQAIKILNECRDRGYERTTYTKEEYHTARDMAIEVLQEQADRNEFYNWDAPIRHKADGEYILKSEAIRVASGYCHPSNIAKELEKLPSVDIPPDHDGCKNCVYQANPQDAMPCRECKHNYMDKWKARPKEEPRYCDRNICMANEYNGIGCDECEVGNPCLYCKHEFEPQERSE